MISWWVIENLYEHRNHIYKIAHNSKECNTTKALNISESKYAKCFHEKHNWSSHLRHSKDQDGRPEPQLSAEYSHLHHQSMSLFSEAAFDVWGKALPLRWLFCEANAPACKQTVIHVYLLTAADSFPSLFVSLSLCSVSGLYPPPPSVTALCVLCLSFPSCPLFMLVFFRTVRLFFCACSASLTLQREECEVHVYMYV